MTDDAVLAALARALDLSGGIDMARVALDGIDPLLRARARRRLRDAHADALLATRVKENEHLLRLTYLIVARVTVDDPDDTAAVTAAYEDARVLRKPALKRFWWPTAIAMLSVILAGGATALAVASDGRPISRILMPRERPTRGAFSSGGIPAPSPSDAVIARVLGSDAPGYLIALDRRSQARRAGAGERDLSRVEADMAEHRDRALGSEARAALGEGPATALAALLDAARAAADGTDRTSDDFAQAVSAFDDALAAEGIGYFADGDVITETDSGRRLVIVYMFRVERVNVFTAGAATVRALHLRRLDKLNWSHGLLGFSRPTLRSAAVLLDQLDEQVLTLIGPGLGAGARVPLYDEESSPPDREAVELRAGELVRAEHGSDANAAPKLGELLSRRQAVVSAWQKRATERGLGLVVPGTLRLPDGFGRQMEGFATRAEIAEMLAVDDGIGNGAVTDAFTAVRDALAASVERHEVQHRLDALAARTVMPKALEGAVGPLLDGAGKERRGASSARSELSAYLAELARDPRSPRVGLTMIARFLFNRHMHGTGESYAAVVVLEGLAEALEVEGRSPLVVRHQVDRHAAAHDYLALSAMPPEKLREAARKLWEKLYEAPFPDLHKQGAP